MDNEAIEVLDKHCYLIRNALDIKEQITLFEDIQSRDKRSSAGDQLPRALYPSPKTVPLGDHKPSIKFGREAEKTVFSELVDKTNQTILATTTDNLCQYKSITLSAIEYESSNESHILKEHVDHDDSFVYLLNMGCTANFVVKGPNMGDRKFFKFNSGDLLVFDASTKGDVLHGIEGIESGCPLELANRFPILQNHRYGIQLRVRF